MSPGLIALLAAVVAALASGAAWRHLNGRMRAVGVRNLPVRDDAALGGNESIPGAASAMPVHPGAGAGPVLSGERLGERLGERATLVQFSSAFCAPCRATRRILTDVAGLVDGVAHVEIDAESRLDLVRELGVLRTPTVLVLDADGRVARRASGQPRKPDVIAALGEAMGVAAGADRAIINGAAADGAIADGAAANGAIADGAIADGAIADGAIADGAAANGAAADQAADQSVAGQATNG